MHDEIQVGHTIGEDQSGFMAGRSCTNSLFILQKIIKKRISVPKKVHLVVIDLEKTYDTELRKKLW